MKKIIWAVNPFDRAASVRMTAEFVQSLSRKLGLRASPTYVVSPAELRVAMGYEFPATVKVRDTAMKLLKRWLKKMKVTDLGEPEVLVSRSALSIRATTGAIDKYALEQGAEAIVVTSKAKTVLRRFFLGSFTEALVAMSRVPVFVINPQVKIDQALTKILLPSDLTELSASAMRYTAKLAKALKAEIVLYHYVESPAPMVYTDFAVIYDLEDAHEQEYIAKQRDVAKRKSKSLMTIAERLKIPCRLVIESGVDPTDVAIVRAAKNEGANLISLPLAGGLIRNFFLGGIARGVLRASSVPVVVSKPSR